MTYESESTPFDMAMELLINDGLDGMADTIKILMVSAMKIERGGYLHADSYERTDQRHSYANGFRPKTIKTRVGEIQLAIGNLHLKCTTQSRASSKNSSLSSPTGKGGENVRY